MNRHPVLALATYFLSGLLFAVGLGVSGMTQPTKVVGFLDVLGDWDPSLAFVMVGGILTHMLLYRFITRRPSPVLGQTFQIPTRRDVTGRLVAGSAMFGVGWAIAGYCPGPGLVGVGAGSGNAVVFLVSMVSGMLLFKLADPMLQRLERPAGDPPETVRSTPAKAK